MTSQQYFVAAFCILFMSGLQIAIERLEPEDGSGHAEADDDETEVSKGPKDEIEDSKEDFEKQKHLAAAWTQTKVREEVRIAVLERPQRFGRRVQILKSLGWRVDESVLEILNDPSQRTKLTTSVDGRYFGKVIPLTVAIDLMEHSSEKLIDPLMPFAKHSNASIRGDVAEVFGKHPSAKTLDILKRALTDGAEDVRHSATMGLGKAKKVDAAIQAELYPIVERMVNDGKNYSAPEALIALDEKKALAYFESETFLKVESPGLSQALHALVERKKNLPREKLLKLIGVQQTSALDNGLGWQMTGAVHLLGRQQHPDDATLFETLIRKNTTASYSSEGYLAYHGLDDLSEKLNETYEKKKWEGLTHPQRIYWAVCDLDSEVNNGGLDQYFSNSTGDHAKEALEALYAIGMPERANRLKKEFARFGAFGPNVDRTIREGQLEKLRKKKEDPFEEFNDAYYADKSSVYASLAIYAVKNKEAFK